MHFKNKKKNNTLTNSIKTKIYKIVFNLSKLRQSAPFFFRSFTQYFQEKFT